MTSITVNAKTKSYEVVIGQDILCQIGERIAPLFKGRAAAIISDNKVFSLYGEAVKHSLESAGFSVIDFTFPNGEKSKNLTVYSAALEKLCANHFSKKDVVVALGGGVTGDLAGFVAATYQRGTGLVQIPTSLLAAVDSSVGGKTAVDLPNGKNEVGAFYQSSLVLCDTKTLNTLPAAEYSNGCAEIIKYAMICDSELFDSLKTKPVCEDYEKYISRCVEIKKEFVENDEFENGARKKLNFGHSFGHSVEALSNYTTPHGSAVSIGMALITKAAVSLGTCESDTYSRLTELLNNYGLPTKTDYLIKELKEPILSDKKCYGKEIDLIMPTKIGECTITKTATDDLERILALGGQK